MSEEFVVGCPVYKRAWVLPRWFEHVEKAAANAGVDPVYAFVVDDRDDETLDAIDQHPGGGYVFTVREKVEHDDVRKWSPKRYHWMVELRNELLGIIRLVQPGLFLSLDSDILLHPEALKNMMETVERCDAVGGKTYMTDVGTRCPSWANMKKDNGLHRVDSTGVIPVQVIMAIKLMTPRAYAVDYRYADQGEDIGWSLACAEAGLRFQWDGRVASKHVMKPSQLDSVDKRVGF